MAILGTMTIYLVYLLGKKVKDNITGLFAALFFAITPIMVVSAHYTKEDTPLVFGVCLALIAIVNLSEKKQIKDYIYAGLACGLAFGIKFQGLSLFLLVVIIHFLPENLSRITEKGFLKERLSGVHLKKLGISFISLLAAFFLSSPVLLFHFVKLLNGINFQINYFATGHHDRIAISALDYFFSFYLIKSIIPGLTIFVFIFSVVGAWSLYKEEKRKIFILLLWCLGYYLLAEISLAKPYPFYSRYILPVIPVLCLFAGFSVAKSISLIKNSPKRLSGLLLGFCLFLIISYPFYISMRYVLSMNPDTRLIVREWMIRHIPQNAVLYEAGFRIKERTFQELEPDSYGKSKQCAENAYFIISSHKFSRYLENPKAVPEQTAMFQEIMSRYYLVKKFTPSFKSYGFNNPVISIYTNRQE
jgi:4-amino-4-deoxy-L-arabinose transferase-like glycosyltransferase